MSLKSFTTYVTKTIEHFYVTKMYCNGLKFTSMLVAISLQFNGQKEQQTQLFTTVTVVHCRRRGVIRQ